MAWLECEAGNLPSAREHFEDALARFEDLSEPPTTSGTAHALAGLGHVVLAQGDSILGRSLGTRVLRHGQAGQGPFIALLGLEVFAHLAVVEGQAERALRLAAMVRAQQRTILGTDAPTWSFMERWLAPAREALGERRAMAAWVAGETASMDEALHLALQQEGVQTPDGPSETWLALSPREREVSLLVAEGPSNRQIADRLVVGERTIETHLHSLLRKFGFRSRFQVAEWVRAHDLVVERD
jgi:DNA-binding CsgD family transcriptional regulator